MLNQQRKFSLVLNCSNWFTHKIKKYHRLSARLIHPSFLDSCVVLGILSVPLDPHGSVWREPVQRWSNSTRYDHNLCHCYPAWASTQFQSLLPRWLYFLILKSRISSLKFTILYRTTMHGLK